MGSARPARRFDALRALGDGPACLALAGRAPSVRFRVPSEVDKSLLRHSANPGNPRTGLRTTPASVGFLAVRHMPGRRLRMMGGVPPLPRATSGVLTPIAASATVPPDALRHRSVHRLPSSRRSLRVDRTSFRTSRPSCRSSRRFDRFSGKRSDAGGYRALISTRIRSVHRSVADESANDAMRRCLHEVHPPRALSPGVLASHFGRARSPFTSGSVDVSTNLRLRVLRIAGVGSPLSGPPARPGFFTLRPSRTRSDRRGGRAHVFAS